MEADIIATVAVGILLAMFTAILGWQNKGRFDALHRDIGALKSENALIRAELVSIHATLVQVALAVSPGPRRPETG